MPDANDTPETKANETGGYPEEAFPNLPNERTYVESVSGPPKLISTVADNAWSDVEPNESWPMMIYILPNGGVLAKRELSTGDGSQFGSPHLAHRSAMVLKVTPETSPGNSNSGTPFNIDVLKFRGDLGDFFRSVTKAFMEQPDAEQKMLQAIFPNVELPENEQ